MHPGIPLLWGWGGDILHVRTCMCWWCMFIMKFLLQRFSNRCISYSRLREYFCHSRFSRHGFKIMHLNPIHVFEKPLVRLLYYYINFEPFLSGISIPFYPRPFRLDLSRLIGQKSSPPHRHWLEAPRLSVVTVRAFSFARQSCTREPQWQLKLLARLYSRLTIWGST